MKALMIGAALAALCVPAVLPEFWVTSLNYVALAALVALGLVMLTGVGGMTSFGQAAFMGIGAYATAYVSGVMHLSVWLGLAFGITCSVLAAFVIGALTLRLSGHFLPLGTLAWSVALFYVFGSVPGLGGQAGLTSIPPISFGGLTLDTNRSFYYLAWAMLSVTYIASINLLQSRPGRAIRALRYGATLGESFGVNTQHYKQVVFVWAAVLASLSGWLYAHYQRFVNPTPFGLNASIEYLFMAVAGGISSLAGALLGAGMLTFLKQVLPGFLSLFDGVVKSLDTVIFGLLLVFLLHRTQDGLWPLIQRVFPLKRRPGVKFSSVPLPKRSPNACGKTVLEVTHLTKRFGGLTAVKDMSLSVRAGEIVVLLGPNGAGKSTTFNLLTGLCQPSGGTIRLLGSEVQGMRTREIMRRGVARSFQHVKLAGGLSVRDNIALGAHLRGGSNVFAAVTRLNQESESHLLAEAGYQADRVGITGLLDKQAGSLSLGEQRLVEVSRALASDPALLLLDEPAAGLRLVEKQELARVLTQLKNEGIGVLLVEHDMDFVMSIADRIVVMNFGEKIAEGNPQEIRRNPAVVEAYLGETI